MKKVNGLLIGLLVVEIEGADYKKMSGECMTDGSRLD